MEEWLTNYAYRIDIEVGVFLLAGILTISVALLTVGIQSIKAAVANPVKTFIKFISNNYGYYKEI